MKTAMMIEYLRRNRRTLVLAVTGILVVTGVAMMTMNGADQYVTASPSITQRFSGVTSEKMVLDFCYQLQTIHGITGVSYRDFSKTDRSVLITVFYDPQEASMHQIRVFLLNSGILW